MIPQDDSTQTPQTPDMIAQAGAQIRSLSDGHEGATPGIDYRLNMPDLDRDTTRQIRDDERAIVLASAVLAVAGEVREVRNAIVDIAEMLRRLAATLEV